LRPLLRKVTLLIRSPLYASAAIGLGISSLALAACASSATPSALSGQFGPALRPATATPTPIPFKFQTVDDPRSNYNEVTAINQLRKVVGVWGGGSGSTVWQSYSARPPYTNLRNMNFPNSQGTFATSLTSNKSIAGYVLDPKHLHGVYGFVENNLKWTLFRDPNGAKGKHAVTEILGINDTGLAVGFYKSAGSGNTEVPFELNVQSTTYTDLSPPEAIGDAAATGINGKGDITGYEKTSAGVKGFFLQAGTYYPFYYTGALATYALSLNWSEQVVGYYVDASHMPHGFLLIGPTRGGGAQDWQTIDAPGAVGTVVTGINNHHDICGFYIDASGIQHGFVAVPVQ